MMSKSFHDIISQPTTDGKYLPIDKPNRRVIELVDCIRMYKNAFVASNETKVRELFLDDCPRAARLSVKHRESKKPALSV